MDFTSCHFYNMKSKKKLLECLYIEEKELYDCINDYKVYISHKGNKCRLIEEPLNRLLLLQKRIKQLFDKHISFNLPSYMLCKKNSSWLNVIEVHRNNQNIMAFDISKFFPSVTYEMVMKLFTKHFNTSSIVAELLARIVTIDYSKIKIQTTVKDWLNQTNLNRRKKISIHHLCTGSCVSVLISELAAYDMFEEINQFCLSKKYNFSVYVDDIHVSSATKFSKSDSRKIIKIIKSYGFESNTKKMRIYTIENDAILTGVVKKKKSNEITIKYEMQNKLERLINSNESGLNDFKIIGLLNTIKLIDKRKYIYYQHIAFKTNNISKEIIKK